MASKPDPDQLYSLTWSEFGSSLTSSVQLFRGGNDLVDVTLAAGGRTFLAHKIVLSAASSFLKKILRSTPCKHPVILLAGILPEDLESLLEFVYRGEVSVPPNKLQSLLQAAQCLSIQGLIPATSANASSQKFEEEPSKVTASQPVPSGALDRDAINSFLPIRGRKRTKQRNSTSSGSKHSRTDSESDNDTQHTLAASSSDSFTEGHRADNNDTGHNREEQVTRGVSSKPVVCPLCGATVKQTRNLRRHLELIHFGGHKLTRVPRRIAADLPQQPPSLDQIVFPLQTLIEDPPETSLTESPSLTNLMPMAASQISSHNLMAQKLALCQQSHRPDEGLCGSNCLLEPIRPTLDPELRGAGSAWDFTDLLDANHASDNSQQETA